MRNACLVIAIAAAACAGKDSPWGNGGNDANPSDSGNGCGVNISFDPTEPIASPNIPIRAITNVVNVDGVLTYLWDVRTNGSTPVPYTMEAPDGSQINFLAPNPGPYYVTVQITGSSLACNHAETYLNVAAPGANWTIYRLHTTAGSSLAPPQESLIQVKGGADIVRNIALDPGFSVPGMVRDNTGTGIQAYLKFMPVGTPTAYTELFSQMNGGYSVRLLGLNHDVLVVPAVAGLAPKLVPWTNATTQLTVGPGTLVTGTVRAPGGAGLGGAKVQLYAGVVPSTLATTVSDGTFSLRADFAANASITVKVTPPAASGLPRLEASATYSLAQALNINYSASLATCDLGGTPVKRGGNNQGNAKVTIVGTSLGGTISTGATSANSVGIVHITATAGGGGQLPATLVPRAALSAVTELSMTDHAVSALDTTTCGGGLTVDAPAMTNVAGTTRNIVTAATIGGIRVEATPSGPLALAGTLPVQATSNGSGAFNLLLATGGRYDIRFSDPLARAAPLAMLNVTPGGSLTATLPKALEISGAVTIVNSGNPVIGASVQILCGGCSGLDAVRPIGETATDTLSKYSVAVPDPGTM